MPTAGSWAFRANKGGLQLEALPGIEEYLALVMQFILAFGVSFLLPVLLMLLNRAGIVSRDALVKARRYVIVGIVALAALITPPDVVSQLMLAMPLLILFEGTLILMRIVERKDAEEKARAEAERQRRRGPCRASPPSPALIAGWFGNGGGGQASTAVSVSGIGPGSGARETP
jgi:sec-independent protein translocase protein TatC